MYRFKQFLEEGKFDKTWEKHGDAITKRLST